MPIRLPILLLTLALAQGLAAEDKGAVMLFKSGGAFEDIKENVQMAITDRGMLVSGELHVSDMLNRTGSDLGFERQVFLKAESIEFCSALMSHKMTQAEPVNLVICPFTIAIFIKADEPEQVYVAFRKQVLAGDAEAIAGEINTMLEEIVNEAIE